MAAADRLEIPRVPWPMGRVMRHLFGLLLLALPLPALAEEVVVAVAANFLTTAEALAERFVEETGHDVTLAHGSTGALTAQAANGAPYDVVLAADALRPARLMETGVGAASKTFAIGRLFLVSRDPVTVETAAADFEGRTVALADPTVAPYGLAATAAMESLALDTATFRPVLVSDVGQVAGVFRTGNAQIAFVAASLLPLVDPPHALALDGRHPPIRQDAVLLTRADGNPAADAFWAFLDGAAARAVIEGAGYALP